MGENLGREQAKHMGGNKACKAHYSLNAAGRLSWGPELKAAALGLRDRERLASDATKVRYSLSAAAATKADTCDPTSMDGIANRGAHGGATKTSWSLTSAVKSPRSVVHM